MPHLDWNIGRLLQVSTDYWASCTLVAGLELGLFAVLDGRLLAPAEAAHLLGCDARGLETLVHALCALGLLEAREGRYTCTSFAREHLSEASGGYLGHTLLHHAHLVPRWSRLAEAVRTGRSVDASVSRLDDARRKHFLLCMRDLASLQAPRVAALLDLGARRHLLDVGGGPGTYAIAFCRHFPDLRATVFDLPATRPVAMEAFEAAGLGGRLAFLPGDLERDAIPGRYDAAWLSQLLHSFGPETCAAILGKAAGALEPGGSLFVQEFLLDDDLDGPLQPALFSLNMLTGTEAGRSYSVGQVKGMMETAGLHDVHRVPFESPSGAGILAGTKA